MTIPHEASDSRIQVREYPFGSRFEGITLSDAKQRLLDGGQQLWIDIDQTQGKDPLLAQVLDARLDALEGFLPDRAGGGENPPRLPPKAKAFAGSIFGRLYWLDVKTPGSMEKDGKRIQVFIQEVQIVAAEDFVVTVRHQPLTWRSLDELFDGKEELVPAAGLAGLAPTEIAEEVDTFIDGTAPKHFGLKFAIILIDAMVDEFFRTLEALRLNADALERRILQRSWLWHEKDARELEEWMTGLRRVLRQVRWAVIPPDEIDEFRWGPFLSETEDLEQKVRLHLSDLDREAERALETVRDVTEQVDDIVATRDSLKTDRLNRTLYVLTVVGTVLLVPTLVAGIYGMNFRHMPELAWRFGYLGAVAAMVVLAAGVWVTIRRVLRRPGSQGDDHPDRGNGAVRESGKAKRRGA